MLKLNKDENSKKLREPKKKITRQRWDRASKKQSMTDMKRREEKETYWDKTIIQRVKDNYNNLGK